MRCSPLASKVRSGVGMGATRVLGLVNSGLALSLTFLQSARLSTIILFTSLCQSVIRIIIIYIYTDYSLDPPTLFNREGTVGHFTLIKAGHLPLLNSGPPSFNGLLLMGRGDVGTEVLEGVEACAAPCLLMSRSHR